MKMAVCRITSQLTLGKKKPPLLNVLSTVQHRHSGKIDTNLHFPDWFLTPQAVHRVIEREQISTVLGFLTAFSHLQKLLGIRDYREAEKYRSEVI